MSFRDGDSINNSEVVALDHIVLQPNLTEEAHQKLQKKMMKKCLEILTDLSKRISAEFSSEENFRLIHEAFSGLLDKDAVKYQMLCSKIYRNIIFNFGE